MSDAEIFLMAWAVIATVVAGVYANKAKREAIEKHLLMETIHEIGIGTATVSVRGNRITIKRGDDDGDSTSK